MERFTKPGGAASPSTQLHFSSPAQARWRNGIGVEWKSGCLFFNEWAGYGPEAPLPHNHSTSINFIDFRFSLFALCFHLQPARRQPLKWNWFKLIKELMNVWMELELAESKTYNPLQRLIAERMELPVNHSIPFHFINSNKKEK